MLSWFRNPTLERGQRLSLVGDSLVIVIAAIVAGTGDSLVRFDWLAVTGLAAVALLLWATFGRVLRHYDVWNGRGVRGDFVLTLILLVAVSAPLALLRFASVRYAQGTELARFWVVLAPGTLWLRLVAIWWQMRSKQPPQPVLVVGTGPLGRHTGLELRDGAAHQRATAYLRFADEPIHSRLPAPIVGTADELEAILKREVFAEIYIAGNGGSHRSEMQSAIRVCERFGIPFALPACGFRFDRAKPAHAKAVADGYVHYLSIQHKPVQRALKRAIDIVASGAALTLLSPLLLTVAAVIKLTSKGPILFKQKRVGLHGTQFNMLKFRSMVVNAEELKAKLMAQNEMSGPVFKLQRDPRITGIGRFIRKYSIDELPQLLNVLRGEMTIVGPRPPLPTEVTQYEAWQRRRLSVRPGLTCVWQVSGRNQISFEEWMYLDMQYIDHWSLAQDLNLIVKTVPVVLTGRGAS